MEACPHWHFERRLLLELWLTKLFWYIVMHWGDYTPSLNYWMISKSAFSLHWPRTMQYFLSQQWMLEGPFFILGFCLTLRHWAFKQRPCLILISNWTDLLRAPRSKRTYFISKFGWFWLHWSFLRWLSPTELWTCDCRCDNNEYHGYQKHPLWLFASMFFAKG